MTPNGMHGRGIERRPGGVALGGVVAVLVAIADRRHGPPVIVGELGVRGYHYLIR